MKKIILLFASLILIAGCGGKEIQLKDSYVYNPVSGMKNKYPVSAALTGSYVSKKVDLKDNVLLVCKNELDSYRLFSEVGIKRTVGYDVIIDMIYTEVEKDGKQGLELNISMKQMPEKKLLYKMKYTSMGDEKSFKTADGFAAVLKKVITDFITDIDAKFTQYQKDGNLPLK